MDATRQDSSDALPGGAEPRLPTYMTRARTRGELPEQVDVAIVGAGTGGLTAAAYLAQAGWKVALFDSHYVAGGCATRFHRSTPSGVFQFDVGLHYIGECWPSGWIAAILAELGIGQDFVELDPDGFDTLVFPDFRFRIPRGLDRFRDRAVAMFPHETRGIDRYFDYVRQTAYARHVMACTDFRMRPLAALQMLFRAPRVALKPYATIGSVLDSCVRDPKLKAVLGGQHGDYALPPSQAVALNHAGLHYHFSGGAFYPRGGGQAISDKLAEDIESHGGTIHLRQGIASILVENGRAVGVRTEERGRKPGREIRARIVLSNADIQQTLLELVGPEHLPAKLVRKARGWEWPPGIFTTYLGLKGDLAPLGLSNSNLWQFDGYDTDRQYAEATQDTELRFRGAYITSGSLKDPEDCAAPEGHETLELMGLMPGDAASWGVESSGIDRWTYRRSEAYQELKQRLEDELLARAEALIPGLSDTIVYRESATPVSHSRFTRSSAGTGYGLSLIPSQFAARRSDVRSPVRDLYLCGVSTRYGVGIIGALCSGRQAARFVSEALGRPLGLGGAPAPHEPPVLATDRPARQLPSPGR